RPATRRRLGGPLPHQLADRPRAPPGTAASSRGHLSPPGPCEPEGPCGISPSFPGLSPAPGWVAHVLLTRPPLGSAPEGTVLARLACVRHAASVRPEPGSNSPKRKLNL